MGPGNEALVVAWAEAALELARKGKPFKGQGRGEEASDWDACQAAKGEHAMLVAHKIALDPNMAQREYFARAAGTARFAYNWALAEWQRQYKAGEKPNDTALRRQLNAIKRAQFPWMFDVTKAAVQEAI